MRKETMNGVMCAVLAAGLLSGCASTRLTNEWRNPDVEKAGPYRKILVTAITTQEGVRRPFEDAFRSALAPLGAVGVSGYTLLPSSEEADKDLLVKAVREAGADAALVVRMVKKETRTSVDNRSHRWAYWGSGDYYVSYHSDWTVYYEPVSSYADDFEHDFDVITLEAKLFDATTEKLVWAASTETTDPRELQKEIGSYATLICKRLGKSGLLGTAAH
jgi:hypothetical protein